MVIDNGIIWRRKFDLSVQVLEEENYMVEEVKEEDKKDKPWKGKISMEEQIELEALEARKGYLETIARKAGKLLNRQMHTIMNSLDIRDFYPVGEIKGHMVPVDIPLSNDEIKEYPVIPEKMHKTLIKLKREHGIALNEADDLDVDISIKLDELHEKYKCPYYPFRIVDGKFQRWKEAQKRKSYSM